MFTGLIEEIGQILKKSSSSRGIEWSISASPSFLSDVKLGDSINVAGVCQTVTKTTATSFSFYSSPVTLEKTNLETYQIHQSVNLEKALQLGSRLGGHFVYGHVQGKGRVVSLLHRGDAVVLVLEIPAEFQNFVTSEGSLTIDGVSLTIATTNPPLLEIHIIPHTWAHTTLQTLKTGNFVNLEMDPLAKMVAHIFQQYSISQKPSTSLEKILQKNDWLS